MNTIEIMTKSGTTVMTTAQENDRKMMLATTKLLMTQMIMNMLL